MRFGKLATLYGVIAAILVGSAVAGAVGLVAIDPVQMTLVGATAGMACGLLVALVVMARLTVATREPAHDPQALLRNPESEKIIRIAPGAWRRGVRHCGGYIALTNHRLFFIPHDTGGPTFNIPLDNVRAVRRYRFARLILLGLRIQRHDRTSESIALPDYQSWHDKINHARRARRPTWVNTGTVEPI